MRDDMANVAALIDASKAEDADKEADEKDDDDGADDADDDDESDGWSAEEKGA
jgi:hypothetical protein